MADDLSLSPFHVYAREDGQQELVLSDGDMVDVEDVFDDLDAFVAGGSDPAVLRRLAERLHAAFHDRSLLSRLIIEADLD